MCFKIHKYKSASIFLFFFVALAGLFFRLIFVQVIKHNEFTKLARQQHDIIIEIPPARGCIYDRRMRPLACDLPVSSLYACPRIIYDRGALATRLSKILNLNPQELGLTLRKDKGFVWVKRHLSPDEVSEIRKLGREQLGLVEEYKRVYPNGPLASHLIGFTDIDNNGLEGLELYYDQYLRGSPGCRWTTRDAVRRDIVSLDTKYIPAQDGCDLILSIDQVVQHITEKYLSEACQEYRAAGGMAVVMIPSTGEILAMANYPDYDPNRRSASDTDSRRNRVVTDFFEPGSSFKIVTASAALEEGTTSLADKIYCENGVYRFGRRILHDAHPYQWLSFPEVIQKSSNIGIAKVALSLGENRLYEYSRNFGFGQITGIDLPGEVPGRLRPLKQWSRIDITSLPMGQGIGVTSIQLASYLNSIANRGQLVKPQVVKYIRHKSGHIIKEFGPVTVRQVISPEVSEAVKDILVGGVENGTGTRAKIEGIKIAGKTGTGQKVDPDGQYSHSRFTASFIGFLPADEPLISIVVVVDEPRPFYYGGTVAAPVFKKIAQDLLGYLDLRLDEEMMFLAHTTTTPELD